MYERANSLFQNVQIKVAVRRSNCAASTLQNCNNITLLVYTETWRYKPGKLQAIAVKLQLSSILRAKSKTWNF